MEPSAKWAEIAAQAIFHTLVASLYVEALVRSWRVAEPRQRMALRLVALGYPLVVVPALLSLFPFRLEEPFHDGPALLVAIRWAEVRPFGVPLFDVWLALFGALGRLSGNPLAEGLAGFYVSVIRGTPLLIQIYLIYSFVTILVLLIFSR